ncbi:hypothetical protein CFE70_005995 [Pyrenophora teres f. teres 0-1]
MAVCSPIPGHSGGLSDKAWPTREGRLDMEEISRRAQQAAQFIKRTGRVAVGAPKLNSGQIPAEIRQPPRHGDGDHPHLHSSTPADDTTANAAVAGHRVVRPSPWAAAPMAEVR